MTSATLRIIARTGSAAFARDAGGRVTSWNLAAERLLHRSTASVLGRPCHEVLAGRDPFGNQYCGPCCPVAHMAFGGAAVRPYTLSIPDASGRRLDVRVSALLVDAAEDPDPELVHVLEPINGEPRQAVGSPDGRTARWTERLSPREREVLALLATGHGTDAIAVELGLSQHTVRNHVAACLRKMDCHSRLEAVSAARRLGVV